MFNQKGAPQNPTREVEEMDEPPSTGAPVGVGCQSTQCHHRHGKFGPIPFAQERARVMRTVPSLPEGSVRGALRVAFEKAQCTGQQR